MCKNCIIYLQWICINILRNAINWVLEAKFLYFFQVLETIFNLSFACIYMADTERHDKFPYKKTNLLLKKIYWGSRVAPLAADHHQTRLLTNFLHSSDCWICMSRIDQAERAAWFAWARFFILLRKLGSCLIDQAATMVKSGSCLIDQDPSLWEVFTKLTQPLRLVCCSVMLLLIIDRIFKGSHYHKLF